MDNLTVKEEEVMDIVGVGGGDCSSQLLLCPVPVEGLHDIQGPPPFLTKIFDIVEDPNTDSIVSWSAARNSFVIWDLPKLSTILLPRYFKHSNFSSFIRQLNTYGFRKVDPDRWEFANEGFLGGQKHLLKNIKRRRHVVSSNTQQQGLDACKEIEQYELEREVIDLRKDRNMLISEITKLRQQQEGSREQLVAIEEQLRVTERKQQHTMVFLSSAIANPRLLEQLLEQKDQSGCEVGRKRRLGDSHSAKDLLAVGGFGNNRYNESEVKMGSEIETLLSAAVADDRHDQSQIVPDIGWEELLNQVQVLGDESQLEVEDLTSKFPCLGGCVGDLLDQL